MKNWINARRLGLFVSVSVYALALAGCKDGSAPLVPASIQVVAGADQVAAVATKVPIAPSVKVVSSGGQTVSNVTVTFTPTAGSGVVVGGTQVTNASGVATVTSWTLGTKTGSSTLNVTVVGVAPVTFTVTASALTPSSIAVQTGDGQTGLVGTALATAPVVRVADFYDNPVAGISVAFAPPVGGAVEHTQAVTDVNGLASPGKWTLSTKAGLQVMKATGNAPNISGSALSITALATAEPAAKLFVATQPSTTNGSGSRLSVQPVVDYRDRYDNLAMSATMPVTASIASGGGTLGGTTSVLPQNGRATFTDLTYTGAGTVQLKFTGGGVSETTSNSFAVPATTQCAGTALMLNFGIGQIARFPTTAPTLPQCLEFGATSNAGEQYLVMFENMSPRGSYAGGVFPGVSSDDGNFSVTIQSGNPSASMASAARMRARATADTPDNAVAGWEFGGKRVYEIEPKEPAGGAPRAMVSRMGRMVDANSINAELKAGDTISLRLEGIPRLGIPAGDRRAIIRLVTTDIVIAEDLRFYNDTTFKRTESSGGLRNSPIADADLQQIATEYATHAKVQADRFFGGRHNSSTEQDPGRPIAVHTMMFADNIWGYTYSTTNYFAWDYWVLSDGQTKQIYQHAQRNADNLFMHEIAHMRHYGMMERAGRSGLRGNQWLVEGFARFSERLPIAMRLLNSVDPSRTGNVVLPLNPAFCCNPATGNPFYFTDDVPTYLQAGNSMYGGYGASAFVFDYFADQVAKAGGNWRIALPELLVAAGNEADINVVINRYLPGLDFGILFTRARIALYADDLPNAGLPDWTQYLQYQLRASRRPSSQAGFDPRNAWPKITPGTNYVDGPRTVPSGGAFGYLIDGTLATGDARITITQGKVLNGVMSVVRIK